MTKHICAICGNIFFVSGWRKKKTCSGKCAHKLQFKTIGHNPRLEHGFARKNNVEKLHGVWRGMLKRCYCKSSRWYKRYGGRGIGVCDEWGNYPEFRKWAMSHGYGLGLTLERIDNDKWYSPLNCRFATRKEQARNRSTSRFVSFNGGRVTVAELAEITGVEYDKLYYRLSTSKWVFNAKTA